MPRPSRISLAPGEERKGTYCAHCMRQQHGVQIPEMVGDACSHCAGIGHDIDYNNGACPMCRTEHESAMTILRAKYANVTRPS